MPNRLAVLTVAVMFLCLHVWPQEKPLPDKKQGQPPSHQAKPANRNPIAQPGMSASDSPKDNGQKGNQAPNNSQTNPGDHSIDYAKWGFLVSVVVAATGLVVAIASLIQAKAAKESADEARVATQFAEKTVKASERADVLLEEAKFEGTLNGSVGKHSWIQLRFKNFGRTRAKNVVIEAHMIIQKSSMSEVADKVKFGPVTLGPGQDKVINLQKFHQAFMSPEQVLHSVGDGTLRFYATVLYEDVFCSTYCPQFIGSYNPQTDSISIDQTS